MRSAAETDRRWDTLRVYVALSVRTHQHNKTPTHSHPPNACECCTRGFRVGVVITMTMYTSCVCVGIDARISRKVLGKYNIIEIDFRCHHRIGRACARRTRRWGLQTNGLPIVFSELDRNRNGPNIIGRIG